MTRLGAGTTTGLWQRRCLLRPTRQRQRPLPRHPGQHTRQRQGLMSQSRRQYWKKMRIGARMRRLQCRCKKGLTASSSKVGLFTVLARLQRGRGIPRAASLTARPAPNSRRASNWRQRTTAFGATVPLATWLWENGSEFCRTLVVLGTSAHQIQGTGTSVCVHFVRRATRTLLDDCSGLRCRRYQVVRSFWPCRRRFPCNLRLRPRPRLKHRVTLRKRSPVAIPAPRSLLLVATMVMAVVVADS
mmetsp:Transcript_121446/g.259305  ORF Transcript_121446/g.259305 Transcript_121446/m.259305 type:complete len:244 (+) Transcript_121446:272-1003(+)